MGFQSYFWTIFGAVTGLKLMLIPSYHSTDFEVHRNWLAITHSLPFNRWYYDATSEWTLDYPPFFAYLEWGLSKIAYLIDPKMLQLNNLNYCSSETKHFQRISVMALDFVYALGVISCLKVLRISKKSHKHFTAEVLLLFNVGLLFLDHIHFQYNGFLYGILLLSISFLLEERYLWSAFTFSILLNFKHIFLYVAPVYAVYLLKFYCLNKTQTFVGKFLKLIVVGSLPFVVSFGPFWNHLPQILNRLFPFKRGLTHAYWAPNIWAIYNSIDKFAAIALAKPKSGSSTTSGLVQEYDHIVLPKVTPIITFVLTILFMLPVLLKLLFYTKKSESGIVFLRAVVLCSCTSFMFGWHVHEKAILMSLLPLCFLSILNSKDASYCIWFSIIGYFSLFPLLFDIDLLVIRYSLYLGYISFMLAQLVRIHKMKPSVNVLHVLYVTGLLIIPLYEHLSPLLGLQQKLPFMTLLLTSLHCGAGLLYAYIQYYIHTLTDRIKISTDSVVEKESKPKMLKNSSSSKNNNKSKRWP
ncbi:probable dolichyl pyrophosphate Glc1Man9GlcNAc2 alpha-1,3-glucosyltransferase [Teleopsis dalmanni]|uniref:probable dolichyl pyrophosphate Glc1Man9GlcNAc2 alpha-1,3-glucosyltransferase n=2 Tax=Teleopsis dalmanni TaxID=139649 RepID=UPI0018CCFECA|nr:probable dolichyl pyrophosphate Glc1Man9GlcNAc2 alpha-1,3-glucosyltransferase [Teleopsis dalmanni]